MEICSQVIRDGGWRNRQSFDSSRICKDIYRKVIIVEFCLTEWLACTGPLVGRSTKRAHRHRVVVDSVDDLRSAGVHKKRSEGPPAGQQIGEVRNLGGSSEALSMTWVYSVKKTQ